MTTTLQVALSGALIGGLYALMAAGISLTWGVLRVINLAHFGLILVGAYLTYQMVTTWQVNPILTVIVSAPVLFALGAGLQWAYDRLNIAEFNSLLVSFGLLIIVVQILQNQFSADPLEVPREHNPYVTGSVRMGDFVIPTSRLVAFGFAVLLLGGGHLLLRRTFLGRGMRAFAQDRTVAAAFGIDHRRLSVLLGGMAGASAAVAGMAFTLANFITPTTAFGLFGVVFAVVILGGLGDLLGTLLAGITVGLVSALGTHFWAAKWERLLLFALIIVALVLRPQGVFARRRTV